MSSQQSKGADEVFCRSCGETIKKQAEICPHCGVRNDESTSTGVSTQRSTSEPHDPSQIETTVGENWWYGIGAGSAIFVMAFLGFAVEPAGLLENVLGFGVLISWVMIPISIYFDAKFVRANSRWNPNSVGYVIASIFWLVNIVAGVVYLYRRHEALGEP